MAGASVKTLKRDVRVSPVSNSRDALALADSWMENCSTVHLHLRLGYRSPGVHPGPTGVPWVPARGQLQKRSASRRQRQCSGLLMPGQEAGHHS
jgi:hypothetical protein